MHMRFSYEVVRRRQTKVDREGEEDLPPSTKTELRGSAPSLFSTYVLLQDYIFLLRVSGDYCPVE